MPSPKISVAVIGVGLVGSEFLSQLGSFFKPSPFTLVSVSSSSKSLFSPSGISFEDWKAELSTSSTKPDLSQLAQRLGQLVKGGDKVVLVENTSSDEVAALYPSFLKEGVSIITPNKKAYSGDLDLYEKITSASLESGARFLHESTVGAGLPIVSTLQDLVATGDKIVKIEGVLSGTLSYIFNEFSTGTENGPSFSSVVKIAREKGYTEPHPGDDLNGVDVARKLTILSRIVPMLRSMLPAGYKSVSTTSLVPSELESIDNGDDFLLRLQAHDDHFDAMRKEASAEGKVLRFVGVIDVHTGEVKASLEKYSTTHAFATSLGGSDNIIMFHTGRYSPRPLIIQGAGAGAAVTAMGVMSDLLKLL